MTNEVMVSVERGIWWELHQTMTDARENAIELHDRHSREEQENSKKTRCIARMYMSEIERLDKLIIYMEQNEGIPF